MYSLECDSCTIYFVPRVRIYVHRKLSATDTSTSTGHGGDRETMTSSSSSSSSSHRRLHTPRSVVTTRERRTYARGSFILDVTRRPFRRDDTISIPPRRPRRIRNVTLYARLPSPRQQNARVWRYCVTFIRIIFISPLTSRVFFFLLPVYGTARPTRWKTTTRFERFRIKTRRLCTMYLVLTFFILYFFFFYPTTYR